MNAFSAYGGERGRRRRMDDQEFRAFLDEVRSLHPISEVVRQWTKLKPAGRELVGLCLAHEERTPSMRVNDAKGTVFCFGCGYTADVFRLIQDQLHCSFIDAVRWLHGSDLPTVDPAEQRQKVERDSAERARDLADARKFWDQCVDPVGTPAEIYARDVRGITMALPSSVRFGVVPVWRASDGKWRDPRPAMVCAVFDKIGDVVGIQRVYVAADGRGKAKLRRPKLTLGRIRGASLRLGPVRPSIIVCEGPEDGLSLAQELPGRSVWPTLGTGLMPAVEYPEEVREIVIAGQNDAAGKEAVQKAALKLAEQGFEVRTMFPRPEFKDWNDQLRGIRR